MSGAFDRDSLRAQLRTWPELQRRIALERVVDEVPDALLERLFDGLAHLHEQRTERHSTAPFLHERVDAHAAATRRGEFYGEYILRNAHGQREPWQTAAWLAATSHLFDLAVLRARLDADEASVASLRVLTALVVEVDDRIDELVTFEDSCAYDHLTHGLGQAARILASSAPEPPEPS